MYVEDNKLFSYGWSNENLNKNINQRSVLY